VTDSGAADPDDAPSLSSAFQPGTQPIGSVSFGPAYARKGHLPTPAERLHISWLCIARRKWWLAGRKGGREKNRSGVESGRFVHLRRTNSVYSCWPTEQQQTSPCRPRLGASA